MLLHREHTQSPRVACSDPPFVALVYWDRVQYRDSVANQWITILIDRTSVPATVFTRTLPEWLLAAPPLPGSGHSYMSDVLQRVRAAVRMVAGGHVGFVAA